MKNRSGGEKHHYSSKGAARGMRDHGGKPAARRPDRTVISPNRQKGFAGGERPYDYARYESEPATPEYMSRLFANHEFAVTDKQLGMFWKYYDLLRRYNASLDLTRIMGIEATVLKHFIDSAVILRWFQPRGPVLDIGSGPGFPGLPLAIMRPDLRIILAESRGKRVGFLEKAILALGLTNVEIFSRSVREDSPLGEDHGKPVREVVTRALEQIPVTLERIVPFISDDGLAAFLKGPDCGDEVLAAQQAFPGIFALERDETYFLPNTTQGRRLVIFRKTRTAK